MKAALRAARQLPRATPGHGAPGQQGPHRIRYLLSATWQPPFLGDTARERFALQSLPMPQGKHFLPRADMLALCAPSPGAQTTPCGYHGPWGTTPGQPGDGGI
jgi:hypothetical protein